MVQRRKQHLREPPPQFSYATQASLLLLLPYWSNSEMLVGEFSQPFSAAHSSAFSVVDVYSHPSPLPPSSGIVRSSREWMASMLV